MNWLDIVLIVLLALSTLSSFRKGFTREIASLTSALCALVLAMWFYALVGSYIAPYVSSPRIAYMIGFVLVVVVVLIAGSMLGWVVSRFLRTIGLSFFDRMLGAAFGLVRGLLVAIALLTAYTAFGPQAEHDSAPGAVLHSRIAPYILDASHYFVAIAPMDLKQSFGKQYSEFRSALDKTVREQRAPKNQGESGNK